MKSVFETFLSLGFDHILDINAYDHILFIVALCAVYKLADWKKVAILVTAFTIGHSLTLGLAALDIIHPPSAIIEFLIPVTIFITAIYNVYREQEGVIVSKRKVQLNYFIALFFGLIHGMGFSNFFRSSLMPGEEDLLIEQLFSFNIGVELGQLIVVALILAASYLAFNVLKVKKREWILFVSGAAAGISLILMLETKFW